MAGEAVIPPPFCCCGADDLRKIRRKSGTLALPNVITRDARCRAVSNAADARLPLAVTLASARIPRDTATTVLSTSALVIRRMAEPRFLVIADPRKHETNVRNADFMTFSRCDRRAR